MRVLTDKEKQINWQVLETSANLHEIMRDIKSEELFSKLVEIDKQLYRIRKTVISEGK